MANKQYNLGGFKLSTNRKIGNWTLVRRIGCGGNGEIWECRDKQKQSAAIKFLKWGKRSLSYKRFRDEITLMEQNSTVPGILPIIDKNLPSQYAKKYDPTLPYFYVMPLAVPAKGKVLNASFDNKILIILELLQMLVILHSQHIAHRDIKPANILLYNNQYVLSDFGLAFFAKKTAKTPVGSKVGPKWTISPQMERDAQSADGFKADVYSMAKTIWIILTGVESSFEGQYQANSIIGLSNMLKDKRYYYPLDKLLSQCTDHDEKNRPNAQELFDRFKEWLQINENWDLRNLMQWTEVQEQLFPSVLPYHAEWRDRNDIVTVLNLLGKYDSLNHMFFPDLGGLDLTGASISHEQDCIELRCENLVYIVKPKRLSFEFIDDLHEWNYFLLESEPLQSVDRSLPAGSVSEEYCEISPGNYEPLQMLDNMSKEEHDRIKPRHVTRYLRGSFVLFHKDSIYNQLVSQYRGEHSHYAPEDFRAAIEKLADKFKGETIATIVERKKAQQH